MKMRKIFAGMAAAAMAMTMAISASAEEVALTGKAITMNDSAIRVNIFNPWGDETCKAVESMEVFDYAVQADVTVKVTGADQVGGKFKMYINGSAGRCC